MAHRVGASPPGHEAGIRAFEMHMQPSETPVPIVDVSPDCSSASDASRRELIASLNLRSDDPSYASSELASSSPVSADQSDDRWVSPWANSGVSLQPSSSVRSQRNWNEFVGYPVSPLPSPLIRGPSELDLHLRMLDEPTPPTPEEGSKTDAFFNSGPQPPLRPPRSISRSASTRIPSSTSESVRVRRMRALSSPNSPAALDRPRPTIPALSFADPLKPMKDESPTKGRDPLALGITEETPSPHLLVPNEALCREKPKRNSRHIHGPSVTVSDDSLLPPDDHRTPSPIEKRGLNDELLKLVDTPTQVEDSAQHRVGPYRVVSQLGTGAFSKVLLAEAPPSSTGKGHRVALKMIACTPWEVDKRMRVSWIREAEILKHISHPCIVQFIDAFRTPEHYTLVLDAVAGGELFDALAHHQSVIAQREWLVRRIFGELASAVGWMHEHKLVHRDIKLENIMLTKLLFAEPETITPAKLGPLPLIKVTDFGLARFINTEQMLETRCGSEEYAAPELIIGKPYDGCKTDAWALGVVLYALITGALPFLQSEADVASEHMRLEDVRERETQKDTAAGERGAKRRKAHLLRIAKGELMWPEAWNSSSCDSPTECSPLLRLVTPAAKHIVTRFLRRDAKKRASCWELWQDPWFLYGSFAFNAAAAPVPFDESTMLATAFETSACGERVPLPYCPLDPRGRRWSEKHARTSSGKAAPVVQHELCS